MGASEHIPVTCQSGPWTQLKMTSVLLTKACEGSLGEGASGKVCSFTLGLFPRIRAPRATFKAVDVTKALQTK